MKPKFNFTNLLSLYLEVYIKPLSYFYAWYISMLLIISLHINIDSTIIIFIELAYLISTILFTYLFLVSIYLVYKFITNPINISSIIEKKVNAKLKRNKRK